MNRAKRKSQRETADRQKQRSAPAPSPGRCPRTGMTVNWKRPYSGEPRGVAHALPVSSVPWIAGGKTYLWPQPRDS